MSKVIAFFQTAAVDLHFSYQTNGSIFAVLPKIRGKRLNSPFRSDPELRT